MASSATCQGASAASRGSTRATDKAFEQSRIRGTVAQIDEVLANPRAPGARERIAELQADLQEIGPAGFERASQIKARLHRQGLLRAGLASKTEDTDPIVRALARAQTPEEMSALMKTLSKPRLIDRVLEYQYVNMLSSPVTQATNISSNAMQIAGRLFLQNPLEFAFSGGSSTGGVAALAEAA